MQHTPRKRFGQNFLQDPYIIRKIIECINPQPDQRIIEIGPGLAALTKPLSECLSHLEVIELDRDIISILQQTFKPSQLTIHQGDALQFDYSFASAGESAPLIRVVGNLPYNISTPILFYLANFPNILNMTFMLQNEVVERICAQHSTSAYGKLSVMLQYKFKCRKLLDVPPESFYPAPKVDSAIVYLQPRSDYAWQEVDEAKLRLVVSSAFNQRRKTLHNSLKNLLTSQQLLSCGVDPQLRAEHVSVAEYIALSKLLASTQSALPI